MLRKDLLRVSRAGGGFQPQFVDRETRPLAARIIGTFQGHVGEPRGELESALEALESDASDFKLVRGFAALLEREATFETDASLPPERARRAAFEAAETVCVASESERESALATAADRLGVAPGDLERSLYADRDVNQVLSAFEPRWSPDELLTQYNLSLAQTALFDATEVRIRSSDPRELVSAVKRVGLMYEMERTERGRELVVTGPDALFRRTRRYGTAFARVLRAVATAPEWHLEATIDDRGTERMLRLGGSDVSVPGAEPVAEPTFDSGIEADFAARFRALDLDWVLVREPEALETGTSVMIPDFAFEYEHADFRVFFEIMGFWTPEYVEKKLSQLADLEDVELFVAVDASLGVGEEVAARDHRVIEYDGTVRVKDVVDVLREYESGLIADASATLPEDLTPDDEIVSIQALANRHGVGVEAIESKGFSEHRLVGRTLVRPAVLETIAEEIEPDMDLSDVDELLSTYGIEDTSAVLSELGYRVAWEGLGGGMIERKDT